MKYFIFWIFWTPLQSFKIVAKYSQAKEHKKASKEEPKARRETKQTKQCDANKAAATHYHCNTFLPWTHLPESYVQD
jgi:hypothetical protein